MPVSTSLHEKNIYIGSDFKVTFVFHASGRKGAESNQEIVCSAC